MNLQAEHLNPIVLNTGLAVHDADWNWRNVNSPFTRLYCVTEGAAQVQLDDGLHDLTPGHLYIVPAFCRHTDICHGHFVHYYLHLYEDSRMDENRLEQFDFPFETEAGTRDPDLFERLCELMPQMMLPQSDPSAYDNHPNLLRSLMKNRQLPFCDKVEVRGIVLQLLARFFKEARLKKTAKDERIGKAIAYIRRHMGENICLETLANRSCLSKDHFIRLFRQEMNMTPLKYINQKKVEKAQLLLLTESVPVKEVAYQLGFEDDSYFNRLFKKMTGMTPQEYRRGQLQAGEKESQKGSSLAGNRTRI